MTIHMSKEELGLMLPGTMTDVLLAEPEYLEAPRLTVLAAVVSALQSVFSGPADSLQLSSTQLADIGISRGDAKEVFGGAYADQGRLLAALQTGRIAGA